MRSIPSDEFIPEVTVGTPIAPKHTTAGHENCAYYLSEGLIRCPHGEEGFGAFYSEDVWKEVKRIVQGLDRLPSYDEINTLKEIFND